MDRRRILHKLLVSALGSENVYFQPPASVKITYPCIVYAREGDNVKHADNNPYRRMKRYEVTVIDRNPDSAIPDRIATFPRCRYVTFFTKDSLNHDIFSLYF